MVSQLFQVLNLVKFDFTSTQPNEEKNPMRNQQHGQNVASDELGAHFYELPSL